MFDLFRRKIPHIADQRVTYTTGDVFLPGAENLVFDQYPRLPLQGIGGIVAGQLRVTEKQTVYQSLALPQQTLIGGIAAGSRYTQPLTNEPDEYGSVQ